MGNRFAFDASYSVEALPSSAPNRTKIHRAATHPDALVNSLVACEAPNCWDLFQRGRKANPDGHCLGWRPKNPDGSLEPYMWYTYNQVNDLVQRLGSALLELDVVPVLEFPEEQYEGARLMRQLGIFSKNRVEWFLCEQTANAYGITLVPLYDTLGHEAVQFIMEQTKMTAVACSGDSIPFLLDEKFPPKYLKHIIAFDAVDSSLIGKAQKAGIQIHSFTELLLKDKTKAPCAGGGSTAVSTLCYTSGTTGNPKGVILTHGNFVATVAAAVRGPLSGSMEVTPEDVHCSYLPLAHVFERIICNVLLSIGAAIGVYSGDTLKLLDDVQILKPSVFISVPRLFNRINDKVFGGVQEKSAIAQRLFTSGLNTKLDNLHAGAIVTHRMWDAIVFNKTRSLMGGNLRYMVVGGAPLDASIQDNMKILFCAPLLEGYGLTETTGASFITNPRDPVAGHVGGVLPCVEFCLESIPEMEYEVTNNPPRGELLLHGHSVFPGYFQNPRETESAIDKDGWFRTGDIAVLLPNGAVKIIDRKKSIFKLAQGEYVAPEKIENIYIQAPLVAQVFVFGYSTKFNLVGVVVPDEESASKWAAKNGKAGNKLKALCADEAFKKAVVADMEATAKGNNLKGFEKVKEISLCSEPFSIENGLLTPTMKLKRHHAKERFENEIDAMYSMCSTAAQPRKTD